MTSYCSGAKMIKSTCSMTWTTMTTFQRMKPGIVLGGYWDEINTW